ncbi:hypothetical protein MKY54_05425 [Paenibacillus sp. FSL P2-0121]
MKLDGKILIITDGKNEHNSKNDWLNSNPATLRDNSEKFPKIKKIG